MSRIGKQPVPVPKGVKVTLNGGQISVQGPKGSLTFQPHQTMKVELDSSKNLVVVSRPDDQRLSRSLHGLTRAVIANMMKGVTDGFQKTLEIVGVGYQAVKKGKSLQLSVGFIKPVVLDPPEGVDVEVPDQTHVTIKGPDRQLVGQFAAEVRRVRPPEPYKGKGIRYQGEVVRRKAGKAFASGASS